MDFEDDNKFFTDRPNNLPDSSIDDEMGPYFVNSTNDYDYALNEFQRSSSTGPTSPASLPTVTLPPGTQDQTKTKISDNSLPTTSAAASKYPAQKQMMADISSFLKHEFSLAFRKVLKEFKDDIVYPPEKYAFVHQKSSVFVSTTDNLDLKSENKSLESFAISKEL